VLLRDVRGLARLFDRVNFAEVDRIIWRRSLWRVTPQQKA